MANHHSQKSKQSKLPNIPPSPRADLNALYGDILYAETVIYGTIKGKADRKRLNEALKCAHRVRQFIAAKMRWKEKLARVVVALEKLERAKNVRRARRG